MLRNNDVSNCMFQAMNPPGFWGWGGVDGWLGCGLSRFRVGGLGLYRVGLLWVKLRDRVAVKGKGCSVGWFRGCAASWARVKGWESGTGWTASPALPASWPPHLHHGEKPYPLENWRPEDWNIYIYIVSCWAYFIMTHKDSMKRASFDPRKPSALTGIPEANAHSRPKREETPGACSTSVGAQLKPGKMMVDAGVAKASFMGARVSGW